jgi:hypothetical protein
MEYQEMPKYKAQSFNTIIAKYNLKKVFGEENREEEIKRLPHICQNCNKEIYWKTCKCESPEFNEDGLCVKYEGGGEICEGKKNTCECDSQNRIQQPSKFISLYEYYQSYGGAEEGGWWYHQSFLQESYECLNGEQADQIRQEMQDFAEELNEASKRQHDKHLSESLDWLEARGLDADYLPEPDGPTEYGITNERFPGESHTGSYRPQYS